MSFFNFKKREEYILTYDIDGKLINETGIVSKQVVPVITQQEVIKVVPPAPIEEIPIVPLPIPPDVWCM